MANSHSLSSRDCEFKRKGWLSEKNFIMALTQRASNTPSSFLINRVHTAYKLKVRDLYAACRGERQ
jgi:hypothetical protein